MTLRHRLSFLYAAAVVLAGCGRQTAADPDDPQLQTTRVGRRLPQSDAVFNPANFTLPMPGVDGGPALPRLPQPSEAGRPVMPPLPGLPGQADGPRLPPAPEVDELPVELRLPELPQPPSFPGTGEPAASGSTDEGPQK
jgi:hypothetical protein